MNEVDPAKHLVRVIEQRSDGFVEFEFSLDETDLWVEMIMDGPAFADFCAANHATVIGEATASHVPPHWGMHDARTWGSHPRGTAL